MLEFAPNTYMLEYQEGAYLCNETGRSAAEFRDPWGGCQTVPEASDGFVD